MREDKPASLPFFQSSHTMNRSIMPNHLHTIVRLKKPETHGVHIETPGAHVETHGRASLQQQQSPPPFVRKPKSISSFIGGFKSAINSKTDDYIDEHHLEIPKYNRDNHFFQPNYWEHIIRNNESFQRISNYICTNPANWKDDQFNPVNQKTGQ